ncbi:MAG: hypothetical protein AABW93_01085 [Nanoarchaeota archaeon]
MGKAIEKILTETIYHQKGTQKETSMSHYKKSVIRTIIIGGFALALGGFGNFFNSVHKSKEMESTHKIQNQSNYETDGRENNCVNYGALSFLLGLAGVVCGVKGDCYRNGRKVFEERGDIGYMAYIGY